MGTIETNRGIARQRMGIIGTNRGIARQRMGIIEVAMTNRDTQASATIIKHDALRCAIMNAEPSHKGNGQG